MAHTETGERMTKIQDLKELEEWHKQQDPWSYENDPEDLKRKNILLSEIPAGTYDNVLDIGCGQGFITRHLPGRKIIGVDISHSAIQNARKFENDRVSFMQSSLFELNNKFDFKFDLIIITGVLYPQYIGQSLNLIYLIIYNILKPGGLLISVHIDEWYRARFPYMTIVDYIYDYKTYVHKLEIYCK